MNHKLNAKIAIGAIAAALAAPAFAQDSTPWWQPHWLTRWIPAHTNTIDTINGNDFRDNRDSTISRNDVPMDQTTLPSARDAQDYSREAWHSSAAPAAAAGAGVGSATMHESPEITALPARGPQAYNSSMAASPEVDEMAQRNEVIIDTPDASRSAAASESDVTVRNTADIGPVHDGVTRDVYTGVEGAGGATASAAGRDGEEIMTQ